MNTLTPDQAVLILILVLCGPSSLALLLVHLNRRRILGWLIRRRKLSPFAARRAVDLALARRFIRTRDVAPLLSDLGLEA